MPCPPCWPGWPSRHLSSWLLIGRDGKASSGRLGVRVGRLRRTPAKCPGSGTADTACVEARACSLAVIQSAVTAIEACSEQQPSPKAPRRRSRAQLGQGSWMLDGCWLVRQPRWPGAARATDRGSYDPWVVASVWSVEVSTRCQRRSPPSTLCRGSHPRPGTDRKLTAGSTRRAGACRPRRRGRWLARARA